jgi:FkbH-like protein
MRGLLDLLPTYRGWSRLPPTEADRLRGDTYRADRARVAEREAHGSMQDFLKSLQLRARVQVLGPHSTAEELERVAQLSQRTNQFNATVRRYSLGEVQRLHESPATVILTLAVLDRFGDYGVVGAAIVTRENALPKLDSLLISCRVLGRGVEEAFVASTVAVVCDRWSVDAVDLEFVPGSKNAQVLEFFQSLGLTPQVASASGSRFRATSPWAEGNCPEHISVTLIDTPDSTTSSDAATTGSR